MNIRHLLALATAAGAVGSEAAAQSARVIAPAPEARATTVYRMRDGERQPGINRAALGVSTTATGTARDTLGVMVTSVTRGSPAERAGIEEGNRLSAINGVSLRANAADVEDNEMSGALVRRLTRELGKVKAGDEVELRVYRDGRTQAIKVKTASSDSLFRRVGNVRVTRESMENRPALGIALGSTGSRRDTLGVLVMSVSDSGPAARAGIEEGNRIAAINGVNLRVAREDAGDRWLAQTKASRLQREISALKPGDNVTLKVYADGRTRDVTLKVARAGDLPRSAGMMIMGNGAMFGGTPSIPPMPPMPPMLGGVRAMRLRSGAETEALDRARVEIERMRPHLERLRTEVPRLRERVRVNERMLEALDDVEFRDDDVRPALAPKAPPAPRAPATPAARVRTTVMM